MSRRRPPPAPVEKFDPPINPKMSCRNCRDALLVTGRFVAGGQQALDSSEVYEYTHGHGSKKCRSKTFAAPTDATWVSVQVGDELRTRAQPQQELFTVNAPGAAETA